MDLLEWIASELEANPDADEIEIPDLETLAELIEE